MSKVTVELTVTHICQNPLDQLSVCCDNEKYIGLIKNKYVGIPENFTEDLTYNIL